MNGKELLLHKRLPHNAANDNKKLQSLRSYNASLAEDLMLDSCFQQHPELHFQQPLLKWVYHGHVFVLHICSYLLHENWEKKDSSEVVATLAKFYFEHIDCAHEIWLMRLKILPQQLSARNRYCWGIEVKNRFNELDQHRYTVFSGPQLRGCKLDWRPLSI